MILNASRPGGGMSPSLEEITPAQSPSLWSPRRGLSLHGPWHWKTQQRYRDKDGSPGSFLHVAAILKLSGEGISYSLCISCSTFQGASFPLFNFATHSWIIFSSCIGCMRVFLSCLITNDRNCQPRAITWWNVFTHTGEATPWPLIWHDFSYCYKFRWENWEDLNQGKQKGKKEAIQNRDEKV